MSRFAAVGHYASYCRCVATQRLSNGKKKGEANRKSGNRYLAWAFVEAAHFAIASYDPVKRFYQRKRAKGNAIVAIKAVAHKLARASYHVLREQVAFDMNKAFA
jgi:transposase